MIWWDWVHEFWQSFGATVAEVEHELAHESHRIVEALEDESANLDVVDVSIPDGGSS